MYDICHPAYYELCKLACSDPVKTTIAFYVYIELCEVKRFWDIRYKYNEELDQFYFEVKKSQNSQMEIYIPWATKYNISFSKIEKIQDILQSERLTFVFKSEDSSSVCYTVSRGLVKPESPETTKKRKEMEEKKANLETEIRKNTSNLYELAKTLRESSDQSCTVNSDISVESEKSVNIELAKTLHESNDPSDTANLDVSVESEKSMNIELVTLHENSNPSCTVNSGINIESEKSVNVESIVKPANIGATAEPKNTDS
ncbi:PREDICTED: uncharacterized protein LOC106748466 [Dinoponera quadriceps]|uniref:Uncharacterized protein LOC106748466 n=1 Tax=Dinoponera quadriceps TaxID=609295 RepID=A0A6P3XVC9_DINQU|nr:PREDICTED: uncharacterized protein LOC106748466 [Dinoponera quadriceps]